MAIGEFIVEIKDHSSSPFITFLGGSFLLWLPWIIAETGYIIAYWKEGIGGGISFICFIFIFYPFDIIGNDVFLVLLTASPSVLYLIYWWLSYRAREKPV